MKLSLSFRFSACLLTVINYAVLVDSPDLVGAFCLWLSSPINSERRRQALNGRFLSCKWDVSELEARFDEILEKDLLRFRLAVE
jgi:hypothetical protein